MDTTTRYKDYGVIAESNNMNAGDNFYTPWFNESEWVKEFILMHDNDQNVDIELQRRDSENIESNVIAFVNLPQTVSGFDVMRMYELMGSSFRFRITNNSGLAITRLKIRMQAFGV